MTGVPSDPVAQVTLLLSGASTACDHDVRAVYLAAARSMLTAHVVRVKQVERALAEMEMELARERRAGGQIGPVESESQKKVIG